MREANSKKIEETRFLYENKSLNDYELEDKDQKALLGCMNKRSYEDVKLSLQIKSYYEIDEEELCLEESTSGESGIDSSNVDRYGFFSIRQKLPKEKNRTMLQFGLLELGNVFFRRGKRIVLEIPHGFYFDQLLNQDNLIWYKEGYDVNKKEINRIEKWRNMAEIFRTNGNTEYSFLNTKKLINRVFKGIPDSWRSAAWYAFLSHSAKKNKSKYSDCELKLKYYELLQLPYAQDFQIDLDVPRTINGHVFFQRQYRDGQRLLFRVLHALSLFYPETGYIQGMASLAATFLCYYDEESAFIMSVRLWEERGILSIFSNSFKNLFACFNELQNRLLKTKVGKKLFSLGIDISTFTTKWYLTLFNHSLSFSTQLRIWDVFIWYDTNEKNKLEILHITAMSLILAMKDTLMKANFETAMRLLTSRIHVIDDDAFLDLIKSHWKLIKNT
ncbi:hypothetical protein T552_01573 [Pneumocystis carinii B80]|uniref:Rab-GAP TBC domain-containing protein n=1 Tax=Pneumocystis carinii (strain B80) TaxID=1408658 RepID=A0A0W4ZKN4_PNEC8|nr:hypothetical protein T552_01573 [Pneumocystis carinii B80]KTW28943.1 hypothetical protein T552_01573 [Pneumocystis carinii B80]